MAIVTVSEKGQVVIPSKVRTLFGITAGTRLELELTGKGFSLSVEPDRKARTAASCVGVAKYKGPRLTLEQMDAARYAKK